MSSSLPDDVAERIRRLPPSAQQAALAYVHALEHRGGGAALLAFQGLIPAEDLALMASAVASDCGRVDEAGW